MHTIHTIYTVLRIHTKFVCCRLSCSPRPYSNFLRLCQGRPSPLSQRCILRISPYFEKKESISISECMAKKSPQKFFGDDRISFLKKVIRKYGPRNFLCSP